MTTETLTETKRRGAESYSYDGRLPLTLAVGEYDRTLGLLDGSVQPKNIKLAARSEPVGEFCKQPVYELYDFAEMSFSWYVMARCRQEPVIALPIFPLRMWVHAFLFCRSDDAYVTPKDLIGKRIGATRYRWTINLWVRGILQEHYGIHPNEFVWVTTEEEGADFEVPTDISLVQRLGSDIEDLLLKGEVDALLLPTPAKLFQKQDPRIRRLFPDCLSEIRTHFQKTNIFPITHTVVMSEALWKEKPWVAPNLVEAFNICQSKCNQFYADPKRLSLVEAPFILEQEKRIFGADPWAHGIDANRHILETFVRYAREQGFISYEPKIEELFAPNTLSI
jgi:4,5-dihydroxyphthalate decarboxylase